MHQTNQPTNHPAVALIFSRRCLNLIRLVWNIQCFIEMLPSMKFFSSPAPHFLCGKQKPFQLFDGLAWIFVHICLYLWCQDESLTYHGPLLLFIVCIVKYIKIEFDILYNYTPSLRSDWLTSPLAPPVGSQKTINVFFYYQKK